MIGYDETKAFQQLNNIYDTLLEIFAIAQSAEITTYEASRHLAQERINKAKSLKTKE
jgi:leucine dehydrogenase